mmetsp:Transcript_267/g.807  ORF Transcript_267/g.807 Transcript_267/m.807 type:complete len:749 (+) Transcript_267:6481-8727(+)
MDAALWCHEDAAGHGANLEGAVPAISSRLPALLGAICGGRARIARAVLRGDRHGRGVVPQGAEVAEHVSWTSERRLRVELDETLESQHAAGVQLRVAEHLAQARVGQVLLVRHASSSAKVAEVRDAHQSIFVAEAVEDVHHDLLSGRGQLGRALVGHAGVGKQRGGGLSLDLEGQENRVRGLDAHLCQASAVLLGAPDLAGHGQPEHGRREAQELSQHAAHLGHRGRTRQPQAELGRRGRLVRDDGGRVLFAASAEMLGRDAARERDDEGRAARREAAVRPDARLCDSSLVGFAKQLVCRYEAAPGHRPAAFLNCVAEAAHDGAHKLGANGLRPGILVLGLERRAELRVKRRKELHRARADLVVIRLEGDAPEVLESLHLLRELAYEELWVLARPRAAQVQRPGGAVGQQEVRHEGAQVGQLHPPRALGEHTAAEQVNHGGGCHDLADGRQGAGCGRAQVAGQELGLLRAQSVRHEAGVERLGLLSGEVQALGGLARVDEHAQASSHRGDEVRVVSAWRPRAKLGAKVAKLCQAGRRDAAVGDPPLGRCMRLGALVNPDDRRQHALEKPEAALQAREQHGATKVRGAGADCGAVVDDGPHDGQQLGTRAGAGLDARKHAGAEGNLHAVMRLLLQKRCEAGLGLSSDLRRGSAQPGVVLSDRGFQSNACRLKVGGAPHLDSSGVLGLGRLGEDALAGGRARRLGRVGGGLGEGHAHGGCRLKGQRPEDVQADGGELDCLLLGHVHEGHC